MSGGKRSPWAKIVLAAEAGRGLRLTAAEVGDLASDYAITTRGENDLLERDSDDDAVGSDPRCAP